MPLLRAQKVTGASLQASLLQDTGQTKGCQGIGTFRNQLTELGLSVNRHGRMQFFKTKKLRNSTESKARMDQRTGRMRQTRPSIDRSINAIGIAARQEGGPNKLFQKRQQAELCEGNVDLRRSCLFSSK